MVLDSFERAMEAACADETYKKGIEMTFGQMTKALEKMGITEEQMEAMESEVRSGK